MIRKKKSDNKGERTNPFIGFLLFFISIILMILTGPLGFIYGLLYSLFKRGFGGIGEYFLKIAVSIDQLGNVVMQHLLNILWVKKGGYYFGNRDETISSALGKNKRLGTLTAFGRLIDALLDKIDPDHSLNSIDYHIEPTDDVKEQIAWIYTKDRKLLCLRNQESPYRIPTADKKVQDSDGETLYRMVKDDLGVELDVASIQQLELFQTRSEGSQKIIRKTCYRAKFTGALSNTNHITELCWLGWADRDAVSELDRKIFDYLSEMGELA